MPNPLEFFGYVYCFSSILAGPAFEYSEYDACTNGKAYEKVRQLQIFSGASFGARVSNMVYWPT